MLYCIAFVALRLRGNPSRRKHVRRNLSNKETFAAIWLGSPQWSRGQLMSRRHHGWRKAPILKLHEYSSAVATFKDMAEAVDKLSVGKRIKGHKPLVLQTRATRKHLYCNLRSQTPSCQGRSLLNLGLEPNLEPKVSLSVFQPGLQPRLELWFSRSASERPRFS